MGMKIDEVRRLYALLPNMTVSKRAEPMVDDGIVEKDSYIPSSGDGEGICSTGNYDAKGQMDDDFSVDFGLENEDTVGAAQYSMKYAKQLMKTVTASEAADGRMPNMK